MKCRYCGANLKKGSTFCGSCDTQIQLTVNAGGSGTVQGTAKTTKYLAIGAIVLLLVTATCF